MRRLFVICLMVMAGCAGCQSVSGPFQPRKPERVDQPGLPINEQEVRGRDRLALPDDHGLAQPTGINPPGMIGR